ncbi:hypothetical protein [Desulfatirhabdium butyrativorans]|uniref:hypothetical protein n=1 Tax=Desulfatirhabdium butyrativorans TaxID=340467 RepID=UPI0003FD92A5|nr:hypothetical protein [Desulfatirhabdium butyrativorans]
MIHLILFISPDAGESGLLLEKTLLDGFFGLRPRICRTFRELEENLRRPVPAIHDRYIYVLFADTRKRLKALVNLMEAFDDLEILLILPDAESSTFSIGTRLRPRFVITRDHRFEELQAVLQKMSGGSETTKSSASQARPSSPSKGLCA